MVLKGDKMTVLELLKIASSYLAIDKELEIFFDETSDTTSATDEAKAKFSKLLLSFNNIINEIALSKLPPTKIVEVTSNLGTNEIDLSDKGCNKILSVRTKNGEALTFLQSGSSVVFDSLYGGKVYVEMSYIPAIYKADDNLDIFQNIGKRLLAIGIASEYYYLEEIFDDARLLREEFEKGLKSICSKNKSMPRREFV